MEENKNTQPCETQDCNCGASSCEAAPKKGFGGWLDRKFRLTEKGTTVRTEVIAGIVTFMTMVYILMVNANMFANPFGDGTNVLGVSFGAIYIATAISAIVGTVLIGLLSNLPLAQASGMGLNAFFVYTMCVGFGLTYANALVLVLIDGLVFIILTVTGLRKQIFSAIPDAVKKAIPAGIGLFIAFIGLQGAGIVVDDGATLVNLVSLNFLSGDAAGTWARIMPVLVCFAGFISISVLSKKGVKGSILWGILISTALYYLLGLTIPTFYAGLTFNFSIGQQFADFGTQAVGKVFTEGFDFSAYATAHGTGNLVLIIVTSALAFCMVDMFDTIGTLYGACARGGLLTAEGDVPNMDKAMLADAIATTTGAICGTSTVTTFVESSSGIAEGGKTGLTSIVVALGFFVAMFLGPIFQLIPGCATAAALIYVGVLMLNGVKEIEWTDPAVSVPSFLTLAMMPLTYNISYGIALGIISYVLIKLFTGKAKDINVLTAVIGLVFAIMFFLTH